MKLSAKDPMDQTCASGPSLGPSPAASVGPGPGPLRLATYTLADAYKGCCRKGTI